LLAESGVAWISLRNGFYAHSVNRLLGSWRETNQIRVPADGPVSWTAREDAAEAAAVFLASDGAHNGPVTLTATTPVHDQLTVRESRHRLARVVFHGSRGEIRHRYRLARLGSAHHGAGTQRTT